MAVRRCLTIALTLSLLTSAQCSDAALRNTHTAPESVKGAAFAIKGAGPALLKGTAAAEAAGVSELLTDLLGKMHETTVKPGTQWIVALLALILGLAALGDGKATFTAILILICAGAAFIFALADFEDRWKDVEHGTLYAYIASFEVAAAVGYVAWKGIEGVKFGIGMAVGFLIFQEVKVLVESKMDCDKLETPMYATAAGTVLVLFGLNLFNSKRIAFTTGILLPICGAGAVVSSLGYFLLFGISFLGKATQDSLLKNHPLEVPPFESFVLMIFRLRSPIDVVGFFSVADLNSVFGKVVLKWDLILGRTFMVIFAFLGIYVQMKKQAAIKKKSRMQSLKGPMAESLIVKRPSAPAL